MIMSFMMTLTAFMFPVIVTTAMFMLSTKKSLDREKSTPFECGFDPKSSARIPFSLRFFLLAVIFLVFDIEIILLMPMPLAMVTNFSSSIFSTFIFLIILIFGLLHEWREGSLNWQI